MFVRNINSYVDSINRELIDRENRIFKDPANSYDYPYGRDYARAQSDSYRASQNVYGSLKQDLTSYLEPGTSPQDFATDFSKGGWDGWLALTQHPQNNPLGFTLAATENAAKKKENEIANAKAEIDRNGGYLDQKKCAEYEKPKTAHSDKEYNLYCTGGPITGRPSWCASEGDIRSGKDVKGQKCLVYETVTPGSTNKTKIDTYVNTPERQLELVRTMDDALNTLFASLLNKFRSQGLSSLGSGGTMFNNASDGFGSNSILDTNGNVIPVNNGGNTVGGGSGTDGSFDITKDLGNTYIKAVDDGAWDARTNTPELLPGQGTKGHFYTVSTGGNTQISPNVNYWARGDKVFYDGTMWKKGVPRYIIDKKGALQIENDYGEVTDDSTAVLSLVMPSLGKLDYCIPGPNPNWRNNIQDALASYIDSVNDTTTPPIDPNTLEQTLQDYAGKVNNRYGPNSPMQGGSGSSNAQLKMSPTGLAITKDMVAYADTISTAQDEASASKVQTEANMKNLIQLKNKVNAIIGAAQRRRDAKRIQQGKQRVPDLCIETEKVTYVSNGVLR